MTDLAPTLDDLDDMLIAAGVDQSISFDLLHAATRDDVVLAARKMGTPSMRRAYAEGCLFRTVAIARERMSWHLVDEALARREVIFLDNETFEALATYEDPTGDTCEGSHP